MEVFSEPQSGGTYTLGEWIEIVVEFSEVVGVSGTPELALTVGSETRQVPFVLSSPSRNVFFFYEVQSSDLDTDGVSIAVDALSLNEGTIQDAAGNDADLSLGSHAITDLSDHRVDGSMDVAPMVTQLRFRSRPENGDTFNLAERIEVLVRFGESVTVEGTPQVALTIGSETRQAALAGSSLDRYFLFSYDVQATDLDNDGISIAADALSLNGGSIRDAAGNDAELNLGSHAITDSSGHKVAGASDPVPMVAELRIVSSPSSDDTYVLGERIEVGVRFNEAVTVKGTPQLALSIGSETRQANFAGLVSSRILVFIYRVQATDLDEDGISIASDALSVHGASIQDASGNEAEAGLGVHAITNASGHRVDGSVDPIPIVTELLIIFEPTSGDTYELGNRIEVRVGFSEAMTVEGTPQLALTIGSETRHASYHGKLGGAGLYFHYEVQATDLDTDGISIEADALSLNGGSIKDATGNDAELSLEGYSVNNASGHKVDGGLDTAPTVKRIVILSDPQSGDTYLQGESIRVLMWFSEAVQVEGAPELELALTIGSNVRQLASRVQSSSRNVFFVYKVQATDLDPDGISIGADALSLTGGSIQDATGHDLDLSLESLAITDDLNHRVDGSKDPAPIVTFVSILSIPQVSDTYMLGNRINVQVGFSEEVTSIGIPELALTVGSETRQAVFTFRDSSSFFFSYQVHATDIDADGISIEADALSLDGGSISDFTGNGADLSLGSLAITNHPGHKLDGRQIALPTGDWSPDLLSRASFWLMDGEATISIRYGGRIEEEGFTYACLSRGGCTVEGRRITEGTIQVLETASESELMVAGLADLVDEKTLFQGKSYNGYELEESTVTLRSVAGETTRVSFLDLDGDLVFVDFSSDDPATEMVITLEEFAGTLEESPYDQPNTRYARGLATVTMINPTELTWLRIVSLGNHIDRVDLALIEDDTFAGAVDGIADIKAVVIEGGGRIGAIDAANANFIGSSGEIGIDASGTVVKRALSIGDITPSEGATPVLRISADSLDPANAAEDETVIGEIQIAGGDLREATGALQIDTGEIVYRFPIVAVDGERSIRNSELRPDLGDGIFKAVTDTFVANPDDYFVTDGQTIGLADSTE